jgi:probable phosphoglycerate mutase
MLLTMTPTVLYLVRHGAIISVSGKAYIGQIEAPLSEEGVEQAWAMRKWLEPVHFSRAFSSDLSRSQRTCRIIAGNHTQSIEVLPALREISLGEWEGFSFREIEQRFPEEYAARGRDMENWRPPGGESFADCRIRVMKALGEILNRVQGNVLLVGHAGVNRLILCDILGIPVANLHNIGQDYGCLNIVDYAERHVRVQLMNYTPRYTRPVEQITSAREKHIAGR